VESLFDSWPFNMESGPSFLGFFALLAVSALAVATVASDRYGWVMDWAAVRAAHARTTPETTSTSADAPYRDVSSAPRAAPRHAVGSVPGPDHYWAIAYLRQGTSAVRDLAFSTAMANGLLTVHDVNRADLLVHRELGPPDDPVMRSMYDKLTTAGAPSSEPDTQTVVSFAAALVAASAAAGAHELRLALELADSGLTRARSTCARMRAIVFGVGAGVECIGIARILRGISLDHPVELLVFECIVFGIAVIFLGINRSKTTSAQADAYLSWLSDVTMSLRADVGAGRRTSPPDVGLAVAVGSATLLSSTDFFAPVAANFAIATSPEFAPRAPGWSGWGGSSGGGGGGGGGGGCGGGGGGGGGGCGGGGGGGGGGCGG